LAVVLARFEYAVLVPEVLRGTLGGGRLVLFLHPESLDFQGLGKGGKKTRRRTITDSSIRQVSRPAPRCRAGHAHGLGRSAGTLHLAAARQLAAGQRLTSKENARPFRAV